MLSFEHYAFFYLVMVAAKDETEQEILNQVLECQKR